MTGAKVIIADKHRNIQALKPESPDMLSAEKLFLFKHPAIGEIQFSIGKPVHSSTATKAAL